MRFSLFIFAIISLSCNDAYQGLSPDEYHSGVSMQSDSVFSIDDFGAVGDGLTLNTAAIQNAIEACALQGGGRVVIPGGTYITGTLKMRNNITVYLTENAVLKGTSDTTLYLRDSITNIKGMILANDVQNIGFDGPGTVHGSGDDPVFFSTDFANGLPGRPDLFAFYNCRRVRFQDITVRNGARWNIALKECDWVTVDKIKVFSRVVANNDGLDLTDCHFVTVSNSFFDVGDDGICPKSQTLRGTKHVVINNCVIKSESNGIKLGTSGYGGYEDITITNCTIYDTRLSGITLQMVEGGSIDRVLVNNVTMKNVNGSIFVKLGKRNSRPTGSIRNVTISNVQAERIGYWRPDTSAAYYKASASPKIGVIIAGQPGYPIENLTLSNIRMNFYGSGNATDAARVMADVPGGYPEYTNYGITPAYGLNLRYVKGLVMDNVKLDNTLADVRPAMLLENSTQAHITNLYAKTVGSAKAYIRLSNVTNGFVTACKPESAAIPFLSLENGSADITIMNNDFSKVPYPFIVDTTVDSTGVFLDYNRL